MNISHIINQRFMIHWPAMYWLGSNCVIQKFDQTAMYLAVAVVSLVVAWKYVIQKSEFVFLIRLIRDIVDREFLTLWIIYRPPTCINFLDFFNKHLDDINLDNEIFLLGDFNINLFHNGKYILKENQAQ